MRVNLLGGTYLARSVIADVQRCINLFPEINPQDAEAPVTHYPTPGKVLRGVAPNGMPIRGMYRISNTFELLVAAGNKLYHAAPTVPLLTFTELGTLSSSAGPVSMIDNGSIVMVVDGSDAGYTVSIGGYVFTTITDPAFQGSNRVDYADTFFLLSRPNSTTFYWSLANSAAFDPLDFANKTGFSDDIMGVVGVHAEAWLIGSETSEVWYLTGDSSLTASTFARVPGALIEQGAAAAGSIARISLDGVGSVFWLSQSREGEYGVMLGQGYQAKNILTPPIAEAIAGYPVTGDAIGFCYQQDGHVFYQLTFPAGNATWVYDLSTGLWHQRAAIDSNGVLGRDWASCASVGPGGILAGDYRNGNIYVLDLNTYTDNLQPVIRVRGFPHMTDDGKRVSYRQFIADMEAGNAPAGTDPVQLQVSLRWSDTRGRSWGNPILQSLGDTGDFLTQLQFQRLGIARDRVFELSWSCPFKTALNGAWCDATTLGT